MKRAIVAAVMMMLACSGEPPPACDGSPLQMLAPGPGEDIRFQYLTCDGSSPLLVCRRAVGAQQVTCDGDHAAQCCTRT